MSDSHRNRSAVEYAQQQQTRQDYWERESRIEALIDRCARALGRGQRRHYRYVAETMHGELLPLLRTHAGRDLLSFDADCRDHDGWDYDALHVFLQRGDELAHRFNGQYATTPLPERRRGQRLIERALWSVTAIAETMEVVNQTYAGRTDAVGFAVKLGEHLQDGRMDIGDPVELVTDEQVDALKILVCGGTGLGKSTGTERFTEDYLRASQHPGRDYKVIDLLGMRQGENWLPDVPQQQDDLRRVREDQGLPPSFAEAEDVDPPEVEILHPLTRDFSEQHLPYDTDAEAFVVQPFTVPASELRKPVMVSLIMSRLSESEEATIREVYDDVDERESDWSLADLADEIAARDELSDKHKSKAIGVLRSLQNEGFIRTHEDDHTLDWEDLLSSTDRYTVFSQALCERDLSALMTFAYLLDRIYRLREGTYSQHELVLVMRELWEVVPHKRRRSFDAREAAVQEAIGQIAMKVMRQNRHAGIHLIADTQEPSDLLKSVRELFNHYVVYSANKDTIDDIFEWTQNNRTRSFWSTMTAKAGQAGIVGQAKPAIENRDIEFVSPVEMVPPSHHHFDVKSDGTGWHARAKYFTPIQTCPECDHEAVERSDCGYFVTCPECNERTLDASGGRNETLRQPARTPGVEWDDSVPDALRIDTFGDRTEGEELPDPTVFPIRAFVQECIMRTPAYNTPKRDVYDAFNAYAAEYGHETWDFESRGVLTEFGRKFTSHVDGKVKSTTAKDGSGKAYQDLRLTDVGQTYLQQARN